MTALLVFPDSDETSDQFSFQVCVIRAEEIVQKTGFAFLDCTSGNFKKLFNYVFKFILFTINDVTQKFT